MKWKTYRLVTPGMDVTMGFQSRKFAIEEAEARAEKVPVQLYSKGLNGEWILIFDSEKGGELS